MSGKRVWVVGTDIGGTFTDVIGVNLETGEQRIGKVASTPPTFFDGVINGLARAADYRALHEFSSLPDFEARIPAVLKQEGPVFATLHLEKGALSPQLDYRRLDDPARREAFKAALRQA